MSMLQLLVVVLQSKQSRLFIRDAICGDIEAICSWLTHQSCMVFVVTA